MSDRFQQARALSSAQERRTVNQLTGVSKTVTNLKEMRNLDDVITDMRAAMDSDYSPELVQNMFAKLVEPYTAGDWLSRRARVIEFMRQVFYRRPDYVEYNTRYTILAEPDARPWVILANSGVENFAKFIFRFSRNALRNSLREVVTSLVFENVAHAQRSDPKVVRDVDLIAVQLYWIFYTCQRCGIFLPNPSIVLKKTDSRVVYRYGRLLFDLPVEYFVLIEIAPNAVFCDRVPNFLVHDIVRDTLDRNLSVSATSVRIDRSWTLEETIFHLSIKRLFNLNSNLVSLAGTRPVELFNIRPGDVYLHAETKSFALVVDVDYMNARVLVTSLKIQQAPGDSLVGARELVPVASLGYLSQAFFTE